MRPDKCYEISAWVESHVQARGNGTRNYSTRGPGTKTESIYATNDKIDKINDLACFTDKEFGTPHFKIPVNAGKLSIEANNEMLRHIVNTHWKSMHFDSHEEAVACLARRRE